RVLANSLKTSNAISLPGITSLNRSGFDAIILYHFDAAELAPSTASKADIATSADSHAMTALHHGGKLECDTSRGECDTSRGERSCHRRSSGYLPWFVRCARRHRQKQLRS